MPAGGDLVVVGRLAAAHGIRGWLVLQSFTDPLENVIGYTPWYLETGDAWREIRVLAHRPHKRGFVVQLDGVDDRTAAEGLRGRLIAVDARQLPATAEDEYYWKDLIGLPVYDPADRLLGHVTGLMETGAHDVLIVAPAFGTAEILIPFVRAVVQRVDIAGGRLIADWDPAY
jgi:16S rRNA processing protein RimM